MAGDIRDSNQSIPRGSLPGATTPPDPVKSPKIYEVFNSPPENSNSLPEGSGLNTAGAHAEVPTLSEALKTIRLQDFKQVHLYPCVRESLLNGIGAAFGVGGLRLLFGAQVFAACSWAVGTFCFAGAASYEYCLVKRGIEKANMKRAVEIIDIRKAKKAEEEAKLKAASEERRKVKEEADRKAEEAKQSRWKFW